MPSLPTPRSLALFVLLSTICLTACGGNMDDDITIVFDPCEPLLLSPDAAATVEQVASLQAAAEMWNARGTSITLDVDLGATNEIPIVFEDAAPMFFGVYRDEQGDVVINERISDQEQRTIVAAHEIGHAFGLEHTEPDADRSVMTPGNTDHGPTLFDVEKLEKLWPGCSLTH